MPLLANRSQGLLLLIFLIALSACGFEPNLIKNLGFAVDAPPQPTPAATRYSLGLTSAGDGLAELTSYRVNQILEFEGIQNGQPTVGQIESLVEIRQQPAAFHQFVRADVITPTTKIANGVSEFFQVDNRIYAKKAGDPTWLTLTGDQARPTDFGLIELDRFIVLPSSVSGPPQPETLNGLSVEHYRFDENDLTNPDIIFEQAQGDLWLATHGNFLIQYIISATLRIARPIPQAHLFDQGHLTLRYTLTDINTNFTISPPPSTNSGIGTFSNLPRPTDAEVITALPTLIEYTSAISSISATLFYRDELTSLEWTENSSEIFNEKSFLTFSREGDTLTILITPADDPGKIKVVLDLKNRP